MLIESFTIDSLKLPLAMAAPASAACTFTKSVFAFVFEWCAVLCGVNVMSWNSSVPFSPAVVIS